LRVKLIIELLDIDNPKVWREMLVPVNMTFDKFSKLIQVAMGWKGYHLYEFREKPDSQYFNIKSPDTHEIFGIDASRVETMDIFMALYNDYIMSKNTENVSNTAKIYYIYDFGDNWQHEIRMLDLVYDDVKYATITDGGGSCPPEDCGGLPGYERLKEFLAGKIDKIDFDEWVPDFDTKGFDADKFDIGQVNGLLQKMF
jgi:hypothetical protein